MTIVRTLAHMKEYISQELKVSDSNPSTLLRFLIPILSVLGEKNREYIGQPKH